MDVFLASDGLLALVTLAVLEIVLGVDNLVFIAIVRGNSRLTDSFDGILRAQDLDVHRVCPWRGP
jgi:hypothetical protein